MLNGYNQIAILLTRGVEDAKNMVGAGRRVVAVSGRLGSDVSLAFSVDSGEEAGSAGGLSDACLKFRIDHITPSPTPLKDIGALPYVSSVTVCILLTGIPVFPASM